MIKSKCDFAGILGLSGLFVFLILILPLDILAVLFALKLLQLGNHFHYGINEGEGL